MFKFRLSIVIMLTVISFLIIEIFSQDANEDKSEDRSKKCPPALPTIDVNVIYKCDSKSSLREVKSRFSRTLAEPDTGNTISFTNFALFNNLYNISFGGNKFQSVSFYNLNIITSSSNGETIVAQYAELNDSVCGQGKFFSLDKLESVDEEPSQDGSTNSESKNSIFRIVGGNCESNCIGKLKIVYTPGTSGRVSQE